MTRHRHIHIHEEDAAGLGGALHAAAGHIKSASQTLGERTAGVVHDQYVLLGPRKSELYRSGELSRVLEMRKEYTKHGLDLSDMTIHKIEGRIGSKLRPGKPIKVTQDVEPSAIRAALADFARTSGGLQLPGARKLREALDVQDRDPARAAELYAESRYDLARLRRR